MPSFCDSLISLYSTTPPVSLVADFFASQALEIAKEFNTYFPLSAMASSLHLHLQSLHEQISCEYIDYTEPIVIPGCVPFRGQDLPPNLFHDRWFSLAYDLALQHFKRYPLADGVFVNSFSEMEESTMRALQKEHNNTTQLVYFVGPIIQTGLLSTKSKGSDCEKWLDNQTPNSVLYVCFGSGGTLSQEQINELAFGLELKWCEILVGFFREPCNSKEVDYQSASNDHDNLLKFLPHGFLERTKEQGLVVPFWKPQIQILSHTSTGGFLTHCGWNSILESIVFGVPMITWPLFAEQKLNAILLTGGLRVGLKVKFKENDIAKIEEISNVVRDLILGEQRSEIQQRIEELKDFAMGALEEDGSSTRAFSQFATLIKTV